jgi:hypothetical protein
VLKCNLAVAAGVLAVALAGCDVSFRADSAGGAGRQSPLVQVETAKEMAKPAAAPEAASETSAPASGAPGQGAEYSVKPAEVGVGVKGQGYGGGLVTEPIRTRFRVEERLNFDQVTYALKLFEASEGRAPKSHEEFMEKIITANNISLPELPAGQSYVYDPEAKQLNVQVPE